ncbi:energy-coupling factor transporter transmembrane protein EcfT [Butyrivibrio sp. DSM 10294]|uniref:energy-coupling factor transporter transmembrane component T family protein n=1 Tax=Butyrivibrio sp. DSM 10294 TaxID=2972457 RepID=UPI00234EC58D|nr:energy-coupling factor transporter transmembrane component T [Butyrivibrio sp. DSM 10294]MDC7292133.1 energy-coupling factor transporter transmembrane protein EcfT [Butyrivibrio sp. DSM 10294]
MARILSYEKKNTFVHRLSGFTKLLFLILWCFAGAMTFETWILVVMLLIGAGVYYVADIKWKQVSSVFIAIMIFMTLNLVAIFFFAPYQGCEIYDSRTAICHLFGNYYLTKEQLFYEFNVCIKYFTVIPSVFVFLTTTDPSELASSLNGVGVPYSIAYSVEIALRYIPDVQDEYTRIKNAQQARGIEMSAKGSLLKRIKNTSLIIFPLIFSSMEKIEVVSNAMELRGFGKKPKRTWYSKRPLTSIDLYVISFITLFCIATMIITFADGNRFFNPFR